MLKKLLTGILVGVLGLFILAYIRPRETQKVLNATIGAFMEPTITTEKDFLTPDHIVEATNVERIKAGLPALGINTKLHTSAQLKVDDMITRQYFEHVSPTGESVSDLGDAVGYSYVIMGENLALGDFASSVALVQAWMNSPGHRANILNESYQEIGVGVQKGMYEGKEVWFAVQHFGTARGVCPAISGALKKDINTVSTILRNKERQITAQRAILESENHPTGETYNMMITTFNELVKSYNDLLKISQQEIKQYNAQVTTFNRCLSTYQKK